MKLMVPRSHMIKFDQVPQGGVEDDDKLVLQLIRQDVQDTIKNHNWRDKAKTKAFKDEKDNN